MIKIIRQVSIQAGEQAAARKKVRQDIHFKIKKKGASAFDAFYHHLLLLLSFLLMHTSLGAMRVSPPPLPSSA